MDDPVADVAAPQAGALQQPVDYHLRVRAYYVGHVRGEEEAELPVIVIPVKAHGVDRIGDDAAGELHDGRPGGRRAGRLSSGDRVMVGRHEGNGRRPVTKEAV